MTLIHLSVTSYSFLYFVTHKTCQIIVVGRDEDPCQPCQEDSSCSSTCSNDVTSKMLENDPNKSHI